jgi:hypothetical protein
MDQGIIYVKRLVLLTGRLITEDHREKLSFTENSLCGTRLTLWSSVTRINHAYDSSFLTF